MTFSEYCEYVKAYRRFSVALGDNRVKPEISDSACDFAFDKWLVPLLTVAERAYVYRRIYKDRPYDSTPPPRGSKPVVLTKTPVRAELDAMAMLLREQRKYW